jgi:FAD/FMN-containing dehydrogenase
MELAELRNRIRGNVTVRSDAGYENRRRSVVWNGLVPRRYPRVIVEVANENDVIEAIRFARSRDLKIAVRGGGHSWAGFALRDESLLIDLQRFNEVSIQLSEQRATVGPTVVGRDLNRRLAAHGLAFPIGHCPTVPMSGYLLNGGLGLNYGAWGPGCASVESATVITADGNLVTASEDENADLLWAVRGSGPGFFGVVTKYTLKLFSAPRSIMTTVYYFAANYAEDLAAWAGAIASVLPKEVELTIFFAAAPYILALQSASTNGFLCMLTATAFTDSDSEAIAALEQVNKCPLSGNCLQKQINIFTPVDALLHMGAMLWPKGHRYLADSLWTNSSPCKVLETTRDQFMSAPSAKSQMTYMLFTGDQCPRPFLGGAYSMCGSTLLLCYAIWEQAGDDVANAEWHRATMTALEKYAVGHYVGESDTINNPLRAERSYSNASWARLQTIRQKYDPDRLFCDYFTSN